MKVCILCETSIREKSNRVYKQSEGVNVNMDILKTKPKVLSCSVA